MFLTFAETLIYFCLNILLLRQFIQVPTNYVLKHKFNKIVNLVQPSLTIKRGVPFADCSASLEEYTQKKKKKDFL